MNGLQLFVPDQADAFGVVRLERISQCASRNKWTLEVHPANVLLVMTPYRWYLILSRHRTLLISIPRVS